MMRRVFAPLVLAGALVAALGPELPRYAARRDIGSAEDVILALGHRAIPPDERRAALETAGDYLENVERRLPHDSTGVLVAGSIALLAGRPAEALEKYRVALARGERPEIDLNIARAHLLRGEFEEASLAAVRAVWVDPFLLQSLPEPTRAPVRQEIDRMEKDLREGRLAEAPQLPAVDRETLDVKR